MAADRLRIGIVGCGDVARRHYLPTLEDLADRVRVAALMDVRRDAAEALAAAVDPWSPGARAFDDLGAMLADGGLDAVIDLAPATRHGSVNQAILDAGLALYSEKPISSTVADADRLIATARERDIPFLCAPGVAVTRRFQWLADLVRSGRYGHATLVVAQHAGPGPAAWREYTGDPRPFYGPGVGPVIDHGVYRLHGMTMLLGPVSRVQAMGAIALPMRHVRAGPLGGEAFAVTTPDHVMMNLEFANGGLGMLLASFGAASTLAPWFEVHMEGATVSFGGQSHEKDAPVSIYIDDDSPVAAQGWTHGIEIPVDDHPVIEAGLRHAVDVLTGAAEPVLTAEHARHVLDIIERAYASIEDGASHATSTTF